MREGIPAAAADADERFSLSLLRSLAHSAAEMLTTLMPAIPANSSPLPLLLMLPGVYVCRRIYLWPQNRVCNLANEIVGRSDLLLSRTRTNKTRDTVSHHTIRTASTMQIAKSQNKVPIL